MDSTEEVLTCVDKCFTHLAMFVLIATGYNFFKKFNNACVLVNIYSNDMQICRWIDMYIVYIYIHVYL